MKLVILLFPLFLLLDSNSLRGATHLLLKKGDKIKGWKRFKKKKKKKRKKKNGKCIFDICELCV